MNGGVVPGGSWRSCTWEMAVTWATAAPIFTWGWKKTLIMATPLSDCDSMCSTSLTVVVMARSLLNTMRVDISWADRPLYPHTIVTTGMSILGKISVGIETMLKTPRIKLKSAKTAKVKGRRHASRTIHIRLVLAPEPGHW